MTPGQFRDLLDDATQAAPPPALHADGTLTAGRARLRRRRGLTAGAGLATAAILAWAVGSVSGGPEADDAGRFATDPPSVRPADDTILTDVIDAAFPTPGAAQLRNIRVQTFLRGWGIERCGGQGAPIDSTADRFEQDTLPNLDLIRERGFTEPVQESLRGFDDDCQIGDELQAAAPAWQDWRDLAEPWRELVDDALRGEELAALKEPMAECLRHETGLEIDGDDPVDSLLGAVDREGDPDGQAARRRAVAFADCGADYFGTLERLLLDQRPALVEQHQGLLEEFAQQLGDMGYTP